MKIKFWLMILINKNSNVGFSVTTSYSDRFFDFRLYSTNNYLKQVMIVIHLIITDLWHTSLPNIIINYNYHRQSVDCCYVFLYPSCTQASAGQTGFQLTTTSRVGKVSQLPIWRIRQHQEAGAYQLTRLVIWRWSHRLDFLLQELHLAGHQP